MGRIRLTRYNPIIICLCIAMLNRVSGFIRANRVTIDEFTLKGFPCDEFTINTAAEDHYHSRVRAD